MVDKDGFESFSINEDDLEQALHGGTRRFRQTKHQATYGMWADDDSDDDRPSLNARKPSKKSKNDSAPMMFVSGGVKHGDRIDKDGDDDNDEDQPDDRPSFSGGRSAMAGGRRKQRNVLYAEEEQNETAFAGLRGAKGTKSSQSFGDWEKHTKGIGAKLLAKMGYEHGKGLGKEGKGIAAPVEAVLRPGRGAVGAYGHEGPKNKPGALGRVAGSKVAVAVEELDLSGDEEKVPRNQWKKEPGRRKPKYKFRTIDDVIAEGGTVNRRAMLGPKSTTTKVIDMTGKKQKVYTGYDAFTTKTIDPSDESIQQQTRKNFDVPELIYNLDQLVEITEEEIIRSDKELKFLKDQNITLKHDVDTLRETIRVESQQIDKSREVIALVESFNERSKTDQLTLEDCSELFQKLQGEFYEEYKLFGLGAIALTTVLPLLKNAFDGWEPLQDPEHGVQLMKEWRQILEDPNSRGGLGLHGDDMDPYHRVVWEVWMPPVRKTTLFWNPRDDCEPMLKLLEAWVAYLPEWILVNLLEQVVLPRLQAEVEEWNPLTDLVPLHSWLHPWLPYMGDRLMPVYPPIRQKLSKALTQWHPSDKSAKMIIKPWKDVFSPESMSSFLAQNIVPKLEAALIAFQVNPANQELDTWRWLMEWLDMVSPEMIAQLLIKHFFPKWHEALFTWLSCVNPNYQEISEWYSGWKTTMPPDVLQVPMVKDQFNHALALMNRAISSTGGPLQRQPMPTPAMSASRGTPQDARLRRAVAAASAASASTPTRFREMVERTAADMNIEFYAEPNRFREGQQVFRVGSVSMYISNKVIFVLDGGDYRPTSLDQLMILAQR